MLRSATFTIGIVLAILAFVGFLMLGGMMAAPPYSVVVAVQDIPAYSTLDPNALGIDAQHINSQVAPTLILREDIAQYVGGFVLENIHAGEPLRKSAIVASGNPQAINRLALVMTDPDKVAMVIPVDPKTTPAYATDFSEIRRQEHVKRALEVAAAGQHNVIMMGPPSIVRMRFCSGSVLECSPKVFLSGFLHFVHPDDSRYNMFVPLSLAPWLAE